MRGPLGGGRVLDVTTVVLGPARQPGMAAFFQVAGRPELQDDPRFTTLESRLANIEVLYEVLREADFTPPEIDVMLSSGATAEAR